MVRLSVDERRQLLVAAAFRVAARDGLAELSTRAVTDEAGMPRGIFHYCFRGKHELIEHLFTHFAVNLHPPARRPWIEGASLATNMAAEIEVVVQELDADPAAFMFYIEMSARMMRDGPGTALSTHAGEYNLAVQRYFGWLAEHGDVEWQAPTDVLERMYNAMMMGAIQRWMIDRDTQAARTTMVTFVEMACALATPRGPRAT